MFLGIVHGKTGANMDNLDKLHFVGNQHSQDWKYKPVITVDCTIPWSTLRYSDHFISCVSDIHFDSSKFLSDLWGEHN